MINSFQPSNALAAVLSSNQDFVAQQYRDFLNREGDSDGINFWVTLLNSGTLTRAQVIKYFYESNEFQWYIAPIARLYFACFQRIPDYGGLQYWINAYTSGTSLASIAQGFVNSQEFINAYGSLSNEAFVTLLYQNVLGREPDTEGYNYWIGQLNAGTVTKGGTIIGFSESNEYKTKIGNNLQVTMMYAGMLRRSPEQTSFDDWVVQFGGGRPVVDLVDVLLSSTEYSSRFSNPTTRSISGMLTGNDSPVSGATIEVYTQSGALLKTQENATDSSGNFNLSVENLTDIYYLKAYEGISVTTGTIFEDQISAVCFDTQCNITPLTTISYYVALKSSSPNLQEINSFFQDSLGVTGWQTSTHEIIPSMAAYAETNSRPLLSIASTLVEDLSDAYLDDENLKILFPLAKIRVQKTITYDIDTSMIENLASRTFVLENIADNTEIEYTSAIAMKDYANEIVFLEKIEASDLDGELTYIRRPIYYAIHGIPAYSGKLNFETTVFAKLFLKPDLINLSIPQKEAIITYAKTNYTDLWIQILETFVNYVNKSDYFYDDFNKQVNVLAQNIITEFINGQNQDLLTVRTNLLTPSPRYAKFKNSRISAKSYDKSLSLGPLSVHVDSKSHEVNIINTVPLYWGLTDIEPDSTDVPEQQVFKDYSGSANPTIDWMSDILGHNLIEADKTGGALGYLINSMFKAILPNDIGDRLSKNTPMSCEAFHTDLCFNENFTPGNYKYVLFKDAKHISIPMILNYVELLKAAGLPFASKITKKLDEISKSKIMKKINLGYVVLDIALSFLEQLTDLPAEINPFKEEMESFHDNFLTPYSNIIGNIKSLIGAVEVDNLYSQFHDENGQLNQKKTLSVLDGFKLYGASILSNSSVPKPPTDIISDKDYWKSYIEAVFMNVLFNIVLAADGKSINYHLEHNEALIQLVKGVTNPTSLTLHHIITCYWNTRESNRDKLMQFWNKNFLRHTTDNGFTGKSYTLKPVGYYKLYFITYKDHPPKKDLIKEMFEKVAPQLTEMDFWLDFINGSFKKLVDSGDISHTLINLLTQLVSEAINDIDKSFVRELILKTLIQYCGPQGWAKVALVANQVGGILGTYAYFPNYITFNLEIKSDGNPTLSKPLPITGHQSGALIPTWEANTPQIEDAFLSTENAVLVVTKDKSKQELNSSFYVPYHQVIFGGTDGSDITSLLMSYKGSTVFESKWSSNICNSVETSFDINSTSCSPFGDSDLNLNITGYDFGWIRSKNFIHQSEGGYWYLDLIDIAKEKFGGWNSWDTFPVYNKTRGIFKDHIEYTFYEKDTGKVIYKPTINDLILFKITDKDRLAIERVNAFTTEGYLTLKNLNDFPVVVIVCKDMLNAIAHTDIDPRRIIRSIPANFEIKITNTDLENIKITQEGQEFSMYVIDGILSEFTRFKGFPSEFETLAHLADRHCLSLPGFMDKYSGTSPYSFIQQFSMTRREEQNKPPVIETFEADVNQGAYSIEVTFYYQAKDIEDGAFLKGIIYFGDGTKSDTLMVADLNDITHTYDSDGEYIANFTVTDSGNKTASDLLSIYAKNSVFNPEVMITPLSAFVNENVYVNIRFESGNPPYTVVINWANENEINETVKENCGFNYAFSSAGEYGVRVSITDNAGKKYETFERVTVINTGAAAEVNTVTSWTAEAHCIDTSDERQNDIPITVTANTDGTTKYTTSWAPTVANERFFVKYHLPIPAHAIPLSQKIRLTTTLKESDMRYYDRELWFITDTQMIASVFMDQSYNENGHFEMTQVSNGATVYETDVSAMADHVAGSDPSSYKTYAMEISQGNITVYAYVNNTYTLLYTYSAGNLGTYLNEIAIAFMGNGAILHAELEYDKNGNGTYDDGKLTLTTQDKNEDWKQWMETSTVGESFTNSLGMTFVRIPAGTFMMGSPTDELGRYTTETQHQVTLTKDYYMMTTEVTQGQWKAVMGSNPSYFASCGDNCPVEQVSWNDIQAFITALNALDGTRQYQLPTEAQWEYAARAESTTAFANGAITNVYADPNLDIMGWYYYNSGDTTHSVAQKQVNAWGLYDMHGNVWEWCSDWNGNYPTSAVIDPTGPTSGSYRVRRGGSWNNYALSCRSAVSYYNDPVDRYNSFGFRLIAN
ncbi:MAG: DUF4214 domain-containing protein [Desulfobacterales bacterium]|nr:DUF4214 domain-containing protein [Desulfobacterales bacterium]